MQWCEGRAAALPFAEARFDAVVSQFAEMFFKAPVTALKEMQRVLRLDGRLVIAVCDAVEQSPGHAALASLLQVWKPSKRPASPSVIHFESVSGNMCNESDATEQSRVVRDCY